MGGILPDTTKLQELANKAITSGTPVTDLTAFAHDYVQVFSTGYNYAFGVAAIAMILSLVIYLIFKNQLPDRKSHG